MKQEYVSAANLLSCCDTNTTSLHTVTQYLVFKKYVNFERNR